MVRMTQPTVSKHRGKMYNAQHRSKGLGFNPTRSTPPHSQ